MCNDETRDSTIMNITIEDIKFCRKLIVKYEVEADKYGRKLRACKPSRRGAYESHKVQALENAKRMRGNLQGQLDWLKVHNRTLFEEVS